MHACRTKRAWPIRVAIFAGLSVLLWALLLRYETAIRGLSPGCFFKHVTGLNCAGCGGTRAFFALLKGDLSLSLRMNPLLITALAGGGLFGSVAVWEALSEGRPRRFQRVRFTAATGWSLLGIALAFWILRNLPWWPFTLLAPP